MHLKRFTPISNGMGQKLKSFVKSTRNRRRSRATYLLLNRLVRALLLLLRSFLVRHRERGKAALTARPMCSLTYHDVGM